LLAASKKNRSRLSKNFSTPQTILRPVLARPDMAEQIAVDSL
jgi:hypothetical protein